MQQSVFQTLSFTKIKAQKPWASPHLLDKSPKSTASLFTNSYSQNPCPHHNSMPFQNATWKREPRSICCNTIFCSHNNIDPQTKHGTSHVSFAPLAGSTWSSSTKGCPNRVNAARPRHLSWGLRSRRYRNLSHC